MPTELRCDFDGPFPKDWLFRLRALVREQGWTVDTIMFRKTAHGWHAIYTVTDSVDPVIVVAAQAILDSDWKRENFNLYRAPRLQDLPSCWREPKRWNALYSSHTHLSKERA